MLQDGKFTEVDKKRKALECKCRVFEEQTRRLENGDNVNNDFQKAREDNMNAYKTCLRIQNEYRRAVNKLENATSQVPTSSPVPTSSSEPTSSP